MKDLKRLAKKVFLKATGSVNHLNRGVRCASEWFGNNYGGFYACPDLLNDRSVVYSFGIGEDISFDKSIIEKFHCKVYGFDPTPKSINWIKQQNLPDGFSFHDYGIGSNTERHKFYLPRNPNHVSGSAMETTNVNSEESIEVQLKSLPDIMTELGHTKIDLLKMDIEGSEYDVIDSIINTETCINQILVEFHDRFFKTVKRKSAAAIQHLKSRGYDIFAVSDSFEEISLVRKSAL